MAHANRGWAKRAQWTLEAELKSPISYQFIVTTITEKFNTIKEHATATTKPMDEAVLDILRPLVEAWLRKGEA